MAQKTILWQTWDGRLVDMKNMSHQHMSNIHYYQNLIYPKLYSKSDKIWIRQMLLNNFGNILFASVFQDYYRDKTLYADNKDLICFRN